MSCGEELDRWKVFGVDGHEERGGKEEKKTIHSKEEEMLEASMEEDSNNNKCFQNLRLDYKANEAAGEMIDMVLDLALISELSVEKDGPAESIDASNVVFACQDVRLKPGFVMPVKVKKPKVVVEKKVVVDTFYDYLASPGECVIVPDVAEETWMEATDVELGKEVADKLKEDKVDVIVNLVEKFGRNTVLDFFWETQKIEESGGLMIMNGARRRSSGGVLFHLLRESKDEKIREKVEEFFAERQNNECRRKKAGSDVKEKLEKSVKKFKGERSHIKKDLSAHEVIDISALFEQGTV